MLKISIQDEPNLVTMKLEGSLAGTWVIELEESWRAVKPKIAGRHLRVHLAEVERAQILATLKQTKWILSGPKGAATRLGLNRSTLQFRMKKLGIARLRDLAEHASSDANARMPTG